MELLIAVLGLVALAVLAVRYGHDSRDGLMTEERELARRGVTWDDLATGPVNGSGRPSEPVTTVGPLHQTRRAGLVPARTGSRQRPHVAGEELASSPPPARR